MQSIPYLVSGASMKLKISSNEQSDKKIIEEVKSFFLPEDIEICALDVGDLVYGQACIELKSSDLISSLKQDKGATTSHLIRQAYNMQQYPVRCVIVTKTIPEIYMDTRFWNINHSDELKEPFDFMKLTGYLASIFVRFNVPVIPYGSIVQVHLKDGRTVSSLAYFIYSILVKANDNKVSIINPIKVTASPYQEQEALLCSIADIGPKTAILLLNHFNTIHAVLNASELQLSSVKGIGPVTSNKIYELIHRKYKL